MSVKRRLPTFLMVFTTALVALLINTTIFASDLAKEKRWAEQIIDSLLDGEAVELNDGHSDFLAIDTPADDSNKELGVIVIHGTGVHPNWPSVIQPLRVQLAVAGWNTLSLQMPILGNDANSEDYELLMKEVPARIDAGIRYLAKGGAKKVVIVAHSMGTRMVNYYLSHKKVYKETQTGTLIVGYVGIGMGADNKNHLAKITIPMLDLYGEKDLPEIINSAPKRLKAGSNNKAYNQQQVAAANHFFDEHNNELLAAVKAALEKF